MSNATSETSLGLGLAARRNGTRMSWDVPDEPTQHAQDVDEGAAVLRAPNQHESMTLEPDEQDIDDEPEWYPPPDEACM